MKCPPQAACPPRVDSCLTSTLFCLILNAHCKETPPGSVS